MEKKSKMEKLQLEHELSKYDEGRESNHIDDSNSLLNEMGLVEE